MESSKEYLIKTSTRILGPFTEEEVSELIVAQQVSLIDEIKRPLGRWTYIREEKKFMEVIRRIREEIEKANEITESSHQRRSHELTPTPTPVTKRRTEDQTDPLGQPLKNISVKSDTVISSSRDRHQTDSKTWMIVGGFFVIALIFIGLIMQKKLISPSFRLSEDNFRELRMKGLDRIALRKFGDLNTEQKFQSVALDEMLGILIAYEKRGPDLKRYLQQQINTPQAPDERARFENFLGIATIQEGKPDQALKHFQAAFSFGPLSRPAEINMGLLELQKQNYEEAFKQFRSMLAGRLRFDEEQRRVVDLGFMASFYSLYEQEPADARKRQYKKFETEFDRIFFDIEKDYFLSFERAYVLFLIKSLFDQENIDIFFDRFLSRMLHPLSVMRRSDYLYWNWLDWSQLTKLCKVQDSSLVQNLLLRAICDLNNHRDEEAEIKLKELMSRSDSQLSTLITFAHFLYRIGRLEEAKTQTLMAVKNFPKHQTALHLLGMICTEMSDKGCARDAFNKVLAMNPQSTDAFLGLSKLGGAELNLQAIETGLPQLDRLHYFPYLEWKAKVAP